MIPQAMFHRHIPLMVLTWALGPALLVMAACGGSTGDGVAATGTHDPSQHTPSAMAEGTPITVAGVHVAAPSVDFGRVPLDTPVSHTFVLSNGGAEPVVVGAARIETLEGC